jgi:hypothetical protein
MNSIEPKAFLSAIWPVNLLTHEMLELRAIHRKDGTIKRGWFPSIDEFLLEAKRCGEGWDIYFGISTRFGSASKKTDCYRVKCVWVDLDKPKLPAFNPEPDFLVSSGNGYHVYWVLKEPVFVRSGKWTEIEAVNRALVKRFGGDIGAVDVSRILRVPGFLNYKYSPPRKVKAFDAISD